MMSTDSEPSRRSSKKQRVVLAALFYLQAVQPYAGTWSHDLHRWLARADRRWSIAQPSLLVILNRLEKLGLVRGLWEQFDSSVERRPPRKYHQLTDAGVEAAIDSLQVLRTYRSRPSWVIIPEKHEGQAAVPILEGFEFAPMPGRLVHAEPSSAAVPSAARVAAIPKSLAAQLPQVVLHDP